MTDTVDPTLTLAERCAHAFAAPVKRRGRECHSHSRVDIIEQHTYWVAALVHGSGAQYYEAYVESYPAKQPPALQMKCTCVAAKDGEPCKHLWALLLEISQQRVELFPGMVGPVAVEICGDAYVHTVPPDQESSIAATSADGARALDARNCGPVNAPARARERGWRTVLNAVGRSLAPRPAHPDGRYIEYRLDRDADLDSDEVTVLLYRRSRRKDGSFGAPRACRQSRVEAETLFDAEDRALVGLLLSNPIADGYAVGWQYYSEHNYSYRGGRVHEAMFDAVLPRLCATGRFYDARDASQAALPLVWDHGPRWRVTLHLARSDRTSGLVLTGALRRGAEQRSLAELTLVGRRGLGRLGCTLTRFDAGSVPWIEALAEQAGVAIQAGDEFRLMQQLCRQAYLPDLVIDPAVGWKLAHEQPKPHLRLSKPSPGIGTLSGRVRFEYGATMVVPHSPRVGVCDDQGKIVYRRDIGAESRMYGVLDAAGLRLLSAAAAATRNGFESPDVEVTVADAPSAIRALVAAGWSVTADGQRVRGQGSYQLRVNSGIDWFDLGAEIRFDDVTAALPELLRAIQRRELYVQLDDGSCGLIPEEWLARFGLVVKLGQVQEQGVRFGRSQAGLLDALLAREPAVEVDATFARLRTQLRQFKRVSARDAPRGFCGTLRPYQRDGLGWMQFLRRFGFGGCLADDMGLGKTVQLLALLELRRRRRLGKGTVRVPSLIVVPRSLVFNWCAEARRFTPRLRVLDYTGSGRHQLREQSGRPFGDCDVVITTYGILRRDIATLSGLRFDYAVLDEAQNIKNAQSQAAKACRLIHAEHRLALTGTPVENRLSDLASIFEFLNPGIVGSAEALKALSAEPEDDQGRTLLARALRPFILRRTKEQVMAELPAKSEHIVYCDLEGPERKRYEQLRNHYRTVFSDQLDQGSDLGGAQIQALEALLRLRQAACHPGLLDDALRGQPSAKLSALCEYLTEIAGSDHKALVFSQFTSLLAIVRDHLDRLGIVWEYLDGKTRDRQARVERFQSDVDCQVFLVSIKAGGSGLNLTAADYVFLLDPWWNPAVEAQAIDRSHRIGQTRPVMAYRLIARDTVEEKVLLLQRDKRALAQAIVSADNGAIGGLTADDLRCLLS